MTSALLDGDHHHGVRLALDALSPALDRILVIGGHAHLFFSLHPWASSRPGPPLLTQDLDLLLPTRGLRVLIEPQPDLTERLRSHGFVERLTGGSSRPNVTYDLDVPYPFRVECLMARIGGARSRGGALASSGEGIGGLAAIRLPHLHLLELEPWEVVVPVGSRTYPVRIPNPAAYVTQKLRVLGRRSTARRAKDVVYVYDTLVMFRHHRKDLGDRFAGRLEKALGKAGLREVAARAERLADPTAADLRGAMEVMEAARQGGQVRGIEMLAAVMRRGLGELLPFTLPG